LRFTERPPSGAFRHDRAVPDAARALSRAAVLFALACAAPSPVHASVPSGSSPPPPPIAGAFVFPVGEELDFEKPHAGEAYGFYVSDPYLAKRGRKHQRTHYGVDLACGRGGSTVRSVASGVVVVADANALIKVKRKQKVKVPVTVNGKKTYKTTTRWRTVTKWRTGWGNYVVVRHTLPSGATVFSLYAHMMPRSVLVKKGDMVAAGQPLGRVGHTGHATSSHLHLEIRRAAPASPDEQSEEIQPEDQRTPEEVSFTQLATTDPMPFLHEHVHGYDDLEPGTWQTRYALAACRDGVLMGDGKDFDPDRAIRLGDFYQALVSTFRLGTPFTTEKWSSTVDALVDAEILDAKTAQRQHAGDQVSRSDALELVLRCLDRHEANACNLAAIDGMQVSLDFNTRFANVEAAAKAQAEARSAAATATAAKRKAEAQRVARANKTAKAAGKTSRTRARRMKPVPPKPVLDPGFEALAQSKKDLTRAESCLLLATALRMGAERISALERAATRVADRG
jgi:murein DD-endopeptidase MepM/ murein hydrolase activator NlpD